MAGEQFGCVLPTVPVRIPKVMAATAQPSHWQDAVQQWADAGQPYVIAGWIAGLTILGGRLLLGFACARRLRRGRRPVSAALADRVAVLAGRLGLRMVPGVFVSDVVCDAVVTGLLRPMVLLPAAWLLETTPELLEAVIAHELAHIRRFDLWVNLFQRLVETILFYHPAVWWLSQRVRLGARCAATNWRSRRPGNAWCMQRHWNSRRSGDWRRRNLFWQSPWELLE